jgi:hypothetical protein
MRYPPYIEKDFSFPTFFHVKINYPHQSLKDIETGDWIQNLPLCIGPGERVAIGVGSRGIANLPVIVRSVCRKLRQIGAEPVIIPAMGSHGGATDIGQKNILTNLGVTEEFCGASVCSSLNVQEIGKVFDEVPVCFSTDALESDHSICINRIKPHTKFKAPVESGIFKMLCIGMGKHQGALIYHHWALKYGFFPLLHAIGNEIMAKSNFRFGIGILEDAYDETMRIEAIPSHQIFEREKALLGMAKKTIPGLPVKQADVLIVRQIGKEISGTGMDPNVTGRTCDLEEDDFSEIFQATRVAILNLSEKSNGNAIGLGNADIITEKVWQGMDYETTVMNALTGISLRKAFVPIRLPNDQKAIQACFATIGPIPPHAVRAIIIRDTLHLTDFWVSQGLVSEIRHIPEAEILEQTMLRFDEKGNLSEL